MKLKTQKDKKTKKLTKNQKKKLAQEQARAKATAPKPKRRVRARTNARPKLVDLELMKRHNFMSSTEATQTRIYPLTPAGNNIYEVENEEVALSVILKLVIKTNQSKALSMDWSTILWDITQQVEALDDDVMVTFTRHYEKIDDHIAEKRIKNRRRLSLLSSKNSKNASAQSTFARHDQGLLRALEIGDGVMAFGAEAIITAPNEKSLERAMDIVQTHLRANDETRGLSYELDINKQLQPFILYGPNPANKNQDVYTEMSTEDAGISAMFVDSGGDRSAHSEYIGISVGKMIKAHAAYPMQYRRALLVGNDTINKTYTLSKKNMIKWKNDLPSQLYWSQVMSRSYLLDGHSVTHFVLDHAASVNHLMNIELNEKNKVALDVTKGFLNILEVIGEMEEDEDPQRIVGRFSTHLNNVVALLSQYRNVDKISTTDDFAAVTKNILTNFFISNKYYTHNPLENIENIRLIGEHDQYKTLADFGAWIAQQRKSNQDRHLTSALAELDIIINSNILPTVPALNTVTSPVIDDFLDVKFRVVDLTGLSIGAIANTGDSTTNVMMISYLNILLPSLKNGDAIFIHGLTRVEGINELLQDMINNAGVSVDIIYTESNQSRALRAKNLIKDSIDFVAIDLYENTISNLIEPFEIAEGYAKSLHETKGTFFIRTRNGSDYIYLDDIL